MLLAVPNVSEGRNAEVIAEIAAAFSSVGGVRLLDVHSDPDHHRSVYTLAGDQASLPEALVAGARVVVRTVDLRDNDGVHPHVGALDVVPIVHREAGARGAACAAALVTAALLAHDPGLPVLMYGALAGGRTRAELRRGGLEALGGRLQRGELRTDFGPQQPHPTAGVTLVGARAPLVAFNLALAPPATVRDAREIAARIRAGAPGGLPGVRALGVELRLGGHAAQVTCNVEDPVAVPLARIVAAVRERAPVGHTELVGLAPRAAFDGFPDDLEIRGFDPRRHVIEAALDGA